jgi:(2S)-methylsuccinyl-CoA dehydrogenase
MARDATADAAKAGDRYADLVAQGCAADTHAEAFHDACEQVGDELLAGRPLDGIGASSEHSLLRDSLRRFAREQIAPLAQDIHRRDLDVPDSIITGIAELGLFGLSVPMSYGGQLAEEPDTKAMLVATEELSAASLAAGGSLITRPEILIRALLKAADEQQKRLWLPAIASGQQLVAVAVTEPDYGSDVASLRCQATRKFDGSWIVNGSKLWCTFAGRAHLLMLLCRTGAAPGHRGLSVFVLEKPSYRGHEFEHLQPSGGSLRARAIPTLGYRGMHTFELSFHDYALPASSMVGAEGQGFYLQMESFAPGRLQTAARAVGLMQGAVGKVVSYATQRRVFGTPLAEHGLVRAMIGRMGVRLEASRQLSYHAAKLTDAGRGQLEASFAKLYASRMAEYVTRDAMQLFGGMGYAEETDISRYFVDSRVLTIFEGAEEVLALKVIGRALTDS